MTEQSQPDPAPQREPSVLDYVKSLFRFGKGEKIQIPEFVDERPSAIGDEPQLVNVKPSGAQTSFPWRACLALALALIAQWFLEPPANTTSLGVAFYIAALSMLGWAILRGEWTLAPTAPDSEATDPLTYRPIPFFVSVALGIWAFIILGNNLFTRLNVLVWSLATLCFLWAFWIKDADFRSPFARLASFLKRDSWTITVSRWTLLLVAATALTIFFRFTQTATVPPEPFSDHAEKLQDVYEVSQGQTHIFFPRNTGREAIQMYWTLLMAKLFGTGLSYLSLKLGTAFLGFFTLPFIYLLGKEIGNPRVGLIAFLLAGVAYWPNVISRIGLRFPLYPLFVAPTLYFLLRGFRTRNRNDFLLSGLFLGMGLHGYSPFRIVPLVVVAAFLLYWLHSQSKGARRNLPVWFAMLAFTSLFVFLPLLRYWVDNPDIFGFRAFSRLSDTEQPLPGPAYEVFASNAVKALTMYNYDDGEMWVNSIPHRPALDVVGGALFLLGFMLVLIRYIRKRHWQDLFLLLSIPLLQLPSTLSLAFPGENPALNRAGAAYIPAFLLGALALDGLLTSLKGGTIRTVLMWALAGSLLYASSMQNYKLVFDTFNESFRQGSWNSSDMGKVILRFKETYGTMDTAWVTPFPYWVDTRLPAVWAGVPNRDMAMWPENLPSTVNIPGPKLFIVKANVDEPAANDQASLDILRSLYPNGQLSMFDSDIPGHDFWIFFVPNQ